MRKKLIFAAIFLLPLPAVAADWEKAGAQGLVQFVYVKKERERDPTIYEEVIRSLCKPGKFCMLLFWTDRTKIPNSLPMSDDSVNTKVANFTFNPSTGYKTFLLTCRINPTPTECF